MGSQVEEDHSIEDREMKREEQGGETKEKRYFSSEELQSHNTPNDLWISIQGKVYNVTDWLEFHPGGDLPLLNLAGQDVTDVFVAYHPGSAWKFLDKFFVGYLRDYQASDVSKDYRKLASDLKKMGVFDQKGALFLYLCALSMALMLAICFYGVLGSDKFWVHIGCGCIMGMIWTQSGWVGHDSGHYQVLSNGKLNRFLQVLTGNCLTGLSIAWWKNNHNAHHIACNSLEFDPDLQHMPLFAVSSRFFSSLNSHFYNRKMVFDRISRYLVSYQHWTFYPVMCFARINLLAQSIFFLITQKKVPKRNQELLGVLVFWLWFPYLVVCLPNWSERILFIICSFSVTGIQHVQFCLNHFSASVYVGRPKGNDWFEAQTKGSLDISCSPWMDWFHGGLQFQVEHHLFPRLPRWQLRKVAPLVRALCKKHGLPYVSVTFWEANSMTIGTLRAAALQARDLSNPAPKNLLWEAVNANG
ncbi:acyl-lipid (9-3)-desaturase [Amborella trichopoda]|uniref:Cytochrome b5 heme-binding domain-containing protein n=1 Tax=Amborella trichopoda TaxID=13333 RepID=W1PLR3_AMBTC|nr:acyl-lipid (9-3)-desaturase [Amborella trichopoda]ERN08621.1 hypothetical protein AMTR_s00017p00184030 [Amborella trichopoda]|eukprot:XP_006847040.1 acyl-lipid (9-3)-desaturase [Amborella trichopoda]